MPVIQILPIDMLETRATDALVRIARLDTDLIAEQPQEFSHFLEKLRGDLREELATIRREVEALGSDWNEFYTLLMSKVEIYDSGNDDEWYDNE